MNGQVYQYVEKQVSDSHAVEMVCAICTEFCVQPVMTQCEHYFCKPCMDSWLAKQPTAPCPTCRAPCGKLAAPPAMIVRMLDRLRVYCAHKTEGCDWIGARVDVETHLANSCQFVPVACPSSQYCQWKGQKQHVAAHVKSQACGAIIRSREVQRQQELQSWFAAVNTKDMIRLNVGGSLFTTSLSTLRKQPQSRLAALFARPEQLCLDENNAVFLDRNPKAFDLMLNYLRTSEINEPQVCLPELKFWHLHCRYARLSSLNLTNLSIGGMDLSGADFDGSDLSGSVLSEANLSSANLNNANLSRVNLSSANLSSANLSSAKLVGAKLVGINLSGVDLSGRDFSGCDLSNANLSNANLSSAKLSGANLSSAKLVGINLSRVDLSGRDFSGCDLSNAKLSEANLSNAKLVGINLIALFLFVVVYVVLLFVTVLSCCCCNFMFMSLFYVGVLLFVAVLCCCFLCCSIFCSFYMLLLLSFYVVVLVVVVLCCCFGCCRFMLLFWLLLLFYVVVGVL